MGRKERRLNALFSFRVHFLFLAASGMLLATQHTSGANLDSEPSAETNSAVAPGPDAKRESGPKGGPEISTNDFKLKIRTNALPATPGSTNGPAGTNFGFHWDLSWKGWNGLELTLKETTPFKSPREMLGLTPRTNIALPSLQFEQLKFTADFGLRLEADAAMYATTGNLDLPNEINLRRARFIARGDAIFLIPLTYKFELGYVPHKFNVTEAWISSDRLNYLGYIVVGIYAPPMGLDLYTSSRDIMFMEPATVLQALAPPNEPGIQIGHPVFDQRATWALGIFKGGVIDGEYGNASQDYGNLMGRLTWLAIDHIAPKSPEDNNYLHLGLSANVQYSSSSTVRYRSRPESYLAPHLIDTGNIDSSASGVVGTEAAYVNGPFCIQGEFLDSLVHENNGDGLNFYGAYAEASWYLTGESRPYDRINGAFKRLVPRENFNFGKGGAWGAFQVAARFSYTDLDDGIFHGGRMAILMGELNWYLHSHVRWMFNAGNGRVSGGANDGHFVIFQTRVGIDF
jgi:phosphate-selective porin OprO/OprP